MKNVISLYLKRSRNNFFDGTEYDQVIISTAPVVWCIKGNRVARVNLITPPRCLLSEHENKLMREIDKRATIIDGVPEVITKAFLDEKDV